MVPVEYQLLINFFRWFVFQEAESSCGHCGVRPKSFVSIEERSAKITAILLSAGAVNTSMDLQKNSLPFYGDAPGQALRHDFFRMRLRFASKVATTNRKSLVLDRRNTGS